MIPLSPLLRALSLSASWLVGLSAGLSMALLAGQVAQLRGALTLSDLTAPETRADALGALSAGLAAMGEAALPLACLLATGLAYSRLRAEGLTRAWETLGLSPSLLLLPALLIGLPCAALSLHLARAVTPRALSELSPRLARLSLARLARPGEAIPLAGGGVARVFERRGSGAEGAGEGGATEIWAAWPSLQIRARGVYTPTPQPTSPSPTLTLRAVESRSKSSHTRLEALTLHLAPPQRLKSVGPPNSTPTHALDPRNPHHAFTLHKRHSLPLSAPLWAILGALLGLRARPPLALALGALSVGASYSILRALELRARFDGGDPALAAWLPVGLLALSVGCGISLPNAPLYTYAARLSAPLRRARQRKSSA